MQNDTLNNLFKNVSIYTIYRIHNFIFIAANFLFNFVYIDRIIKKLRFANTVLEGPKGFRRFRLPEFTDDRHKKFKNTPLC